MDQHGADMLSRGVLHVSTPGKPEIDIVSGPGARDLDKIQQTVSDEARALLRLLTIITR